MRCNLTELDEPAAGLRGAIAVCAPEGGPAFGGIRVAAYPDLETLRKDACRLAEAMAYKCRIHGMPGAGAKVVVDRAAIRDRRATFLRLGDLVQARAGRLFVGTDAGTTPEDLAVMRERTGYIACGELSREAADGVLHAIRGACEFVGLSVRGLRASVQGLGAVGAKVAAGLVAEGAEVCGSDVDADRARLAGVHLVPPEKIATVKCFLFSPCALGGLLDLETARRLRCRLVVGAANNPLSDDSVAYELHRRGILYVPDFMANAGALIRGAWTHLRGTPGTDEEIAGIRARTLELLREAAARGVPPLVAAYHSAGL